MAFTRKFLKEQGVPEDKIDVILAERNRTLDDYILKSDVEDQFQKRLEEELAKKTFDPTTTEEYKNMENKVNMYSSFESSDFDTVKKPYREMIWNELDHAENHTPYNEQMKDLQKKYPDMFTETQVEDNKPVFGSETQGSVPSGDKKESFSDYWGYNKK